MPLHDLDLHRRTVAVRGQRPISLSVIDAGSSGPEARTLVFLHGFGGYALQWKGQMLAFAGSHRVVAPDLRGHGLSERPRGAYSVDELVRDLECVVEALELPPAFTLLGHSFGGAIASTYIVRHPERVERLVLIGTSVDFFALHPGARIAFHLPGRLLEPIRSLFPKQLAAPAHVLRSMYHNALSTWDGDAVLGRVMQPTLVVMGERDEVFSRSAYDAVPDRIANSQVVKVSVSAHLVHLERPDAVNRAIGRFLEARPETTRAAPAKPPELLVERPWLRHYEPGVPHTLRFPPIPVHRLLDTAAERFPARRAVIHGSQGIRYRELREVADRLARALSERGVRSGDRVAVLLENSPELVAAHLGVFKAGAVVVSLNPRQEGERLARQVEDAGATTLIVDPSSLPGGAWPRPPRNVAQVLLAEPGTAFSPARAAARRVLRAGAAAARAWPPGAAVATLRSALEQARDDLVLGEARPEDVALIEYSSGMTGEPKGVMLTHANLVANVVQLRHWLQDLVDGQEVTLCALPLWHSYGITACTNLGLSVAATLVIPGDADTAGLLRIIARHRPTVFPGVPDLYLRISDHPRVRRFDLKSIRACVSGAAALPLEVQEVFERLTRGRLVEGYGLTEASPITHVNPFYGLRKSGSIGVPLPDTEARVVDPRSGEPRPVDETGELVVRGPQVMKGYWNRADLTGRVLRDGWLHTGDLARMDADGYFRIVDRRDDVIVRPEGAVYPREVEEVLYEHPLVREAAVIGSADGGPAVVAHVVLRPGERLTAEELIAFCRGRLPDFALPGRVTFAAELPKSFMGKVLKTGLRGTPPDGPGTSA